MSLTPNQVTKFKAKLTRGAERQISCEVARCANQEHGWMIVLATPAQQDLIDMVRTGGTRKRYVERIESPGTVTFYFRAGQDCFENHWERYPIFDIGRVEGGRTLIYPDGDAFVEDSDSHLRKLRRVING